MERMGEFTTIIPVGISLVFILCPFPALDFICLRGKHADGISWNSPLDAFYSRCIYLFFIFKKTFIYLFGQRVKKCE